MFVDFVFALVVDSVFLLLHSLLGEFLLLDLPFPVLVGGDAETQWCSLVHEGVFSVEFHHDVSVRREASRCAEVLSRRACVTFFWSQTNRRCDDRFMAGHVIDDPAPQQSEIDEVEELLRGCVGTRAAEVR